MIRPSLLFVVASALAAPGFASSSSLAGASGTGHAAWHPADSVLYVELPDLLGARSAWSKTAIARVIGDPEVHKALGELMGQASLDPAATLMGLLRENAPPDKVELATELLAALRAASFSISPTEASREVVASGVDDPAELLSAFGLEFVLSFDSVASASHLMDFVGELLEGQGAEFVLETLTWNDVPGALIRGVGEGELGDHLRLVRVGQDLVFVAGVARLEDVQKRMQGDGPSMAASEAWTKGASLFKGQGTTVVNLYSDLMEYAPIEGEQIDPLFEMAEGLFGTNGSILTRGGLWRMQLRDGQYVTDGFQTRDATSHVERILARGPLDPKALAFVNPKAIVAWAVQFEPAAVVSTIRGETAEDDGDAFSRFEAEHGVKLDEMILALGKSATFSMPTPPLMAAPDLQVSLALADREKFLGGIESLIAFLRTSLEGNATIELKDYRDVQLTTLEFTMDLGIEGLPVDPAQLFKPTMAVLEDRVLFTATQGFAKSVVRQAAKGEAEVHEFLQGVTIPEGVSEFGYADWAKMIGSLYTMGRSFGAMAASSMEPGAIPFDLTKLPEADLFLRHFKPSLRWEKRVDGGMLHHSESSFGPDLLLALAIGVPVAQMAASGF